METVLTAPVGTPSWVHAIQILSVIAAAVLIPLMLIALAKLISWLSRASH